MLLAQSTPINAISNADFWVGFQESWEMRFLYRFELLRRVCGNLKVGVLPGVLSQSSEY
jgi:hypothetical protein